MAPEFSESVLSSSYTKTDDDIRELFLGFHNGSFFEYCRMIMVPTHSRGWWCLYIWDMKNRKIHVLDPMHSTTDQKLQKRLHTQFVTPIHEQLASWKSELFTGWEEDFSGFDEEYYNGMHGLAEHGDCAFYVIHYLRSFNGNCLMSGINAEIAMDMRKRLLCKLITMPGNVGFKPDCIMNAISV